MFKQANTRKHVREHSCSSLRVFLSILAHLAHLAQFFSDLKCDKYLKVFNYGKIKKQTNLRIAKTYEDLVRFA